MKKSGQSGDIQKLKTPFFSLFSNKGIVNKKDNMGRTPLHIAAFYGHKGNIETLIQLGADVNAEDNLKMVF
jgi:ankyrin repeat protein